MKTTIITQTLFAAIIIAAFWYLRPAAVNTATTTTISRDTTTVQNYYPQTTINKHFHIDSSRTIIPNIIDTAAIIERFFTTKEYRQTLTENEVEVSITDTIGRNALLSRVVRVQNNRATRIETVLPAPKIGFYGGLRAGYIQRGQVPVMVQPVVGLEVKRWRVDAGYDLLNRAGVVGVYRRW
jgi:hypothetical protein